MRLSYLFCAASALLLSGCVTMPAGPNVLVLPGSAKDFDQFAADDALCRRWASRQIGNAPNQANDEAARAAAVGTVVGAATGAAIGAAAGDPAMGAAVGSGVGLFGGTTAGAGNSQAAQWTLQHRYDNAYIQCMYAKGNKIPVRGDVHQQRSEAPPRTGPPPPHVPPPPAGSPPPPPVGAY